MVSSISVFDLLTGAPALTISALETESEFYPQIGRVVCPTRWDFPLSDPRDTCPGRFEERLLGRAHLGRFF